MRPLANMTLEECRQEEKREAVYFDRLLADRDKAQARLNAYLKRRTELTERIIELLREKSKHEN